jgi:transposase InsO family protein
MAQSGLWARKKRRFVHTTQADPTHRPSANLLARDFQAAAPNRKWVSDIKHIPTDEGEVYLAVTLDLFSRRVVGWAMEDTLEATLTIKALTMALRSRQPAQDALLHSDRGSQYTAAGYRQLLAAHGLVQSMSRKGNCWDNAAMEAFFSTLAFECLQGRRFPTRAQAKTEVFSYIETFYNRKRLHSTLGYVSPEEFEARNQPISTVH